MKGIISQLDADRIFLFAAVAGPLLGIILGAIFGAHKKFALPAIIKGAYIGCAGVLIWGLWHLFAANCSLIGLDAARNIVLQICIVIFAGAVAAVCSAKVNSLIRRMNN